MENQPPKVVIEKIALYENNYVGYGKVWSAAKLIQFCKEKDYPIFDLPLAGVNLARMPFAVDNLDNFIYQFQRVNDCDLEHPIILDHYGGIADGNHRICKAILEGRTTIKAIRMVEMPTHDSEVKED